MYQFLVMKKFDGFIPLYPSSMNTRMFRAYSRSYNTFYFFGGLAMASPSRIFLPS